MSAPIAEIPPPAPRSAQKKPPTTLTFAAIVGLILGALILIFYTPQIPEITPLAERAMMGILVLIFYALPLVLMWRGLNWARWLMITLSVFGIIYGISEPFIAAGPGDVPTSPVENFLNGLSIFYDVALIIFLLTPAMRRHFASAPAETPTK